VNWRDCQAFDKKILVGPCLSIDWDDLCPVPLRRDVGHHCTHCLACVACDEAFRIVWELLGGEADQVLFAVSLVQEASE
jgi:hypothetical protein